MGKKINILFYIRNSKISVYEYINNEFEVIQDCGEDEIEYSDEFIRWLKRAIAYIKNKNKLDFLIITDNSVELNFEEFDIVDASIWNKDMIKAFNISILQNKGLVLKNIKNREYYSYNTKGDYLEYTVKFCDKRVNASLKYEIKKEVEKSRNNKIKEAKQEIVNCEKDILEINKNNSDNTPKNNKESIDIGEYYRELNRKQEEERKKLIAGLKNN